MASGITLDRTPPNGHSRQKWGILDFQTQCMVQQGYSRLTRAELASIQWGLRFTPTVCMVGSAYGLLTWNPYVLFGLALLGIVPFWFPDKHPLDRV